MTTLMVIMNSIYSSLRWVMGVHNVKPIKGFLPLPCNSIPRKKESSSSHSLSLSLSLSQFSYLIPSSILYIKVRYILSLLLWFTLYLSLFYNKEIIIINISPLNLFTSIMLCSVSKKVLEKEKNMIFSYKKKIKLN